MKDTIVRVYIYPLSDRVSFIDETLKHGIHPIGCGLENAREIKA